MGIHAQEEIPIGIYRHHKGHYYEVLGLARHSETFEEFICYRSCYYSSDWGNNPIWVRPKALFLKKVKKNGKLIPRFEFVGPK